MRALQAIVVALLCGAVIGCESEQFRAETRLLPDGSLDRMVYQPANRTPEKAQAKAAWLESDLVPKAESAEQRRQPLSALSDDLRTRRTGTNTPYWLAKGKFADAHAIPDHLVFEAPKGLPNGRLARTLERLDAGFVTEWIWEEILTDAVTLSDQRLARIEVADLAATLTIAACADAWGPDYDLKPLEQWLRKDATACFQELCDLLVQQALTIHRTPKNPDDFTARAAKIVQRFGLDLLDPQQQVIKDQQELQKRVLAFLTSNLERLVRDKQDQPLRPELLADTIKTLAPSESQDPEKPEVETRLTQAFHRAISGQFGSKDKFDEQANRLGVRILGLYNWPILHGERTFNYRLEVPGVVLETNATMLGEQTLRWSFDAAEAFPLGYPMRATVAVLNQEAWKKYFPRARFDNREVLVEYLELVAEDDNLRAALNDLAMRNDATAWKTWQIEHTDAKRLLALLQP